MTLPERREQTLIRIHSPSSWILIIVDFLRKLITYLCRCIGVFDTVGNLGLPEELTMGSQKMTTIFGFSDKLLGEHIEYAFHALALNETRADFVSMRILSMCQGLINSAELCQIRTN